MTTHLTIGSLVAAISVAVGLGACVQPRSRTSVDELVSVKWYPLAIRFDNGERERVHVYLLGDRREWLLGRVDPGAVATLRIPEASLAEGEGFVRLAGAHR